MTKFKPGDKVVCIDNKDIGNSIFCKVYNLSLGAIYVVGRESSISNTIIIMGNTQVGFFTRRFKLYQVLNIVNDF